MAKAVPKDLGRVVFARVGLMPRYAGPVPGDERPIGGGKYNQTEIGSEVLNFKKCGCRIYGYFETGGSSKTNLGRIDADAAASSSLDDVLVVLVAPHPERGQVIVGWYRSAKVLREPKPRPAPTDDHNYRCIAMLHNPEDAVLLPDSRRVYPIPTGKGAIGQKNVCYPLDKHGINMEYRKTPLG